MQSMAGCPFDYEMGEWVRGSEGKGFICRDKSHRGEVNFENVDWAMKNRNGATGGGLSPLLHRKEKIFRGKKKKA